MKLSFPRRLIAVLMAAVVTNGLGLHVAMLPALAGTAPVDHVKTQEQSHFGAQHAGCVAGPKCPLCALSGCDGAVVIAAAEALGEGAAPPPGPAPQDGLVAASDRRATRIRGPPVFHS